MSEWREPEWRIPRRGEVVRDFDGNLGRVLRSEGTLQKRVLWIQDEKGTEIHSGVESEAFQLVDSQTASDFQHRRYDLMGYRVGALCNYKGNLNIPLEILQMDWNPVRYKMTICMRDRRSFKSEIMKTEERSLIVPFSMDFPPVETIFSSQDSGLKYRLEVNLVEKNNEGWAGTGSPWEFFRIEDALEEVENWKARLMIRRVASVLNADWKIQFPCWTVDAILEDGVILTRVREVETLNGSPGYFRSATHAALAVQMVKEKTWLKALSSSLDSLNF
jgi:hypothetical protein